MPEATSNVEFSHKILEHQHLATRARGDEYVKITVFLATGAYWIATFPRA